MQMRAAILNTSGVERPYQETKPLTIADVELQGPGSGEVLVKIAAAGLCHSDLSVIDGNRPRPTPMALGHEASGVVVEVGDNVSTVAPGDHVVLVFVPSCGHCIPCASGRPALCEPGAASNTAGTLLSGAHRLSKDNQLINHHLGVSAFAEYATVSERSVIKIDPDFDLIHAALFGCAVLTGMGAVVNTGHVPPGAKVAVVGLGGVGLCSVLGAIVSGASEIVAIDLQEDKLKLAQELGATRIVNAGSDDAVQQIKEFTKGGVDYAFEMAGSVPALQLAYDITCRGGTTITAGLPHPDKRLSLAPVQLVAEERTLKGSYIGTCIPRRDLPRYMALHRKGVLPVEKLLSEIIPLEDINLGFENLATGKAIRQVITFD
jgi:alcohol dehydrogenase